jgi:NAD(P)-dependent dehydrogenase (short-subunit alcohol dehydrogenase family)
MQKVALLTGGTSKIGWDIAFLLHKLDFDLVMQYHSDASKIKAQKLLNNGVVKFAIQVDFTAHDFSTNILDTIYTNYHYKSI